MGWLQIHLYRLDPVRLDDSRWSASSVTRTIRVAAATAARARQIAADMTRSDGSNAGRGPVSPWLCDFLTTCKMESSSTDLPVGSVVVADDDSNAAAGIRS